MKHKHYGLIVAWANGATIQYENKLECQGEWLYFINDPIWNYDLNLRIKPEPKPDEIRYARASAHDTGAKHTTWWSQSKSGQDNVKAVFDGETGKLKSMEIIK